MHISAFVKTGADNILCLIFYSYMFVIGLLNP